MTDRVPLYDRNGEPAGECPIDTRCWCSHTLGQHYPSHCVEGCPCGGDYPPRLPEGKQGFGTAMPQPSPVTTCFRCDTEVEPTLGKPRSPEHTLCEDCKVRLQQKVDEAVRSIEFEMVSGLFQRKQVSRSRPWTDKLIEAVGYLVIGAAITFITHRIGWWK